MADKYSHLSDDELEAIANKGKVKDEFVDTHPHLSDADLEKIAAQKSTSDVTHPSGTTKDDDGPSIIGSFEKGAERFGTMTGDRNLAGMGEWLGTKIAEHTSNMDPEAKAAFERHVLSNAFQRGHDEQQRSTDEAYDAHPVPYVAGGAVGAGMTSVAGGMGAAALEKGGVSGPALTAAKTLLAPTGAVKSGAVIGGETALAGSTGDSSDRILQTAKGAGAGALFGLASQAASTAASPLISRVGSYFSPQELKIASVGGSASDAAQKGARGFPAAVQHADELGLFHPADNVTFNPDTAELMGTGQGKVGLSKKELLVRSDEILQKAAPKVTELANAASEAGQKINLQDVDFKPVDDVILNLRRAGTPQAMSQANNIQQFVQTHAEQLHGGVSPTDALAIKRGLYNQIRSMGGYGAHENSGMVEAMDHVADSYKGAIENAVDRAVPEASGLFQKLNQAEGTAIKIRGSLQDSIASEGIDKAQNFKIGDVPNLMGSSVGIGPDTPQMLQRAAIGRSVQGLREKSGEILTHIANIHPELAVQAKQILSLPANQMAVAVQPFLKAFQDDFEPAPYQSYFDGKVWDPQDKASHRQYISENVPSKIEQAKQMSALNKDGTVVELPKQ